MTDPVILLGTQSNGETLPVQVNEFGQLVAEGLPGSEGPPGPPGVGQLPPDPYEGALLGWLNGGLAWVSGGVTPIPGDIFGPITNWDSQNGLLSVEGGIPESIVNGTYVYQCDSNGALVCPGFDVSQDWVDLTVGQTGPNNSKSEAYDNSLDTIAYAESGNGSLTLTASGFTSGAEIVVTTEENNDGGGNRPSDLAYCRINGQTYVAENQATNKERTGTVDNEGKIQITWTSYTNTGAPGWLYSAAKKISVNGVTLLDRNYSTGMRVNQQFQGMLLGNKEGFGTFVPGLYLKVPEQRVANWLVRGVVPTSLIDHLRQTQD